VLLGDVSERSAECKLGLSGQLNNCTAANRLAGHKIPYLLWEPKIHHLVHKSLQFGAMPRHF
jgi:hypothetical protein